MVELPYDIPSNESPPHLLDHMWACNVPDMEIISLEHHLAMVLDTQDSPWPMQLFNTAETAQLLNTQPCLMSSILTNHKVAVNSRAMVVWLGVITEAAIGTIGLGE